MYFMDKTADIALIRKALVAIGRMGVTDVILEPQRAGGHADAKVDLVFGGADATYAVEVKRHLRPATLGATVHRMDRHHGKALLVTDHVTPQLADTLRDRGIQFIDTAGNAYLNQPPLLVWVKGQRPIEALADAPAGRAFQATGLQVLFTLLCKPEAVNLPYRDIAALAGVAHGTVGWVLPELPALGFMAEIRKQRRLLDGERLLTAWVEAYLQKLRPKLLLGRYEAKDLAWTTDMDAGRYDLLLGGEPAAARITRNLRPGTAAFYGAKVPPGLLIDQRLRPDQNGNVEILERFWTFDGERPGLVPDVLVYADLLATGDARCLEIAQEMRGGIVDRLK